MEPDSLQIIRVDTHVGELVSDLLCDCRAHLFEDLSAFLNKQFVGLPNATLVSAIQESEIISDVIGEQRLQARVENVPAR